MDAATAYSIWGSLSRYEFRHEQDKANHVSPLDGARLVARLGILSVRVFEADLPVEAMREYVKVLDQQWELQRG